MTKTCRVGIDCVKPTASQGSIGKASPRSSSAYALIGVGFAIHFGLLACSSSSDSSSSNGGSSSSSGGSSSSSGGSSSSSGGSATFGGGTSSDAVIGTFSLDLNPPVGDASPYASIIGTVYGSAYPTDVIETAVASNESCTVYKFSRQTCTSPACTSSQTCVGTNVCQEKPSLVNVGTVTLTGMGTAALELKAINNNYQYPLELPYPGFADGGTVTLSASGGYFPAFSITTKGVAPAELTAKSYLIANGSPLNLEWTPGSAATAAKVSILFNISKHGGAAGYMKCNTTDSGSFSVPANLLKALTDLGVAGFPQLYFTRSTQADTSVATGKIVFEVGALANPELKVEGYCSCFQDSECGTCSDKTKTKCDTVKKLCNAP